MALWNDIVRIFNGNTAAGSGVITRFTYTVPNGKRARLIHSFLQINGNAAAANTLVAEVQANISGTGVFVARMMDRSGNAVNFAQTFIHDIHLNSGDTVSGITTNTSAVIVAMVVDIEIQEYK